MVKIYTKQRCPQCEATKRRMRKNGVDYIEEDAISHLDDLKTMGFMAAPVVMTDQTNWSGYRPDLIDALTTVNV